MTPTPQEEFQLYTQDKQAWAKAVARRRARMLAQEPCPIRRRAMWQAFGKESQTAIRALSVPNPPIPGA